MNTEQLMLLDPDDITFEELDTSQLRELALARTYGDSRKAISALGELSQRAYREESTRRVVTDLAARILNDSETTEHLQAYALSVLYWHDQAAATTMITTIAKDCPEVVLRDIVDCLTPDLSIHSDQSMFRAAATAIAQRLEQDAELRTRRVEYAEYLEEYRRLKPHQPSGPKA